MKNKLFLALFFAALSFEAVLKAGIIDKTNFVKGIKFISLSGTAALSLAYNKAQQEAVHNLEFKLKEEIAHTDYLKKELEKKDRALKKSDDISILFFCTTILAVFIGAIK